MSLIDNTNNLTTKLAALWRKVKTKATAQGASIDNTDSITQIVDKMPSEVLQHIKLSEKETIKGNAIDYLINDVCSSIVLPANAGYYFSGFKINTYPSTIDGNNVTSAIHLFNGCTLGDMSNLSLPNATSFSGSFFNAIYDKIDLSVSKKLKQADSMFAYSVGNGVIISADSTAYMQNMFYGAPNTYNILIYNLCMQQSCTINSATFGMSAWGQGSAKARQSLVDSLLTYSFDRAAAGYAALTITLPAASLALLTDAEKAAITAKGFTLAS